MEKSEIVWQENPALDTESPLNISLMAGCRQSLRESVIVLGFRDRWASIQSVTVIG